MDPKCVYRWLLFWLNFACLKVQKNRHDDKSAWTNWFWHHQWQCSTSGTDHSSLILFDWRNKHQLLFSCFALHSVVARSLQLGFLVVVCWVPLLALTAHLTPFLLPTVCYPTTLLRNTLNFENFMHSQILQNPTDMRWKTDFTVMTLWPKVRLSHDLAACGPLSLSLKSIGQTGSAGSKKLLKCFMDLKFDSVWARNFVCVCAKDNVTVLFPYFMKLSLLQ